MNNQPASIFLAAPDMPGNVLPILYPAFNNDQARFRVLSVTADWEDVLNDVPRYRPEGVVIEAALAPDPDALRQFLARLPAGTVAVVVLPPVPAWAERKGQFEAIQTSVRGVFIGPVNWASVASAVHTAVITERTRATEIAPATALYQQTAAVGARPVVVGTRTIAFTSFAGGTGKSTIAEALAVELARNHVKTLLCSFNSPPAILGHFKLVVAPNATEWLNRPTPQGFQASLQKVIGLDDLDVLLSPDDPETLMRAAARAPGDPASIQQLVFAAYSFNYGAVLLDLPPFADSMWAVQPILAANMAVIVARPTIHDQFAAIRAYRLFTATLAAQHRVPLESIFAVLNFVSPESNMSAQDFQGGIINQTGGRFPPIMASFPYTCKIPAVQNMFDSPMLASGCDEFARAARSLATKLVGGTPLSSGNGHGEKQGLFGKLGISIKLK